MTTHKTISSLSIAAIALMAAAVPAMAQSQTEPSAKSAQVDSATTVIEQTIASNLESATVRKSRAITPNVEPAASKPVVLSTSAFKGQSHFTSAANNSNFANQVNFKDAGPIDPEAKRQFRADESDSTRTKSVAFVPSRGQKLPE